MFRGERSYSIYILWLVLLAIAIGLAMYESEKKVRLENILVGYARFQPYEKNIQAYYLRYREMPKPADVFQVTGLGEKNASCHLAGHCPVYYEKFEENQHRAYMSVLLGQKDDSGRIFKAYIGDPKTGQVTILCGPWEKTLDNVFDVEKVYPQCQVEMKKILGL